MRAKSRVSVGLVLLASVSVVQAATGTAVEYYNRSLNHYFITAYPEEVLALDAGTNVKGWTRTGGEFTVETASGPDRAAVCRFFGTPGKGPNSHFYTADPAECTKVKTLPAWTFEGVAFYIPLPVAGACGPGTVPVYRSYYSDNISDANHRFTVDLTAHTRMIRRGDTLEGVVMCATPSAAEVEADIVRLLEQSTMGATEALVTEVKQKGIAPWLDEQLGLYDSKFAARPQWGWGLSMAERVACITDIFCSWDKMGSNTLMWEFFAQAQTGRDQVRQRFAYVLHQLLVLGQGGPSETYAIGNFEQRIREVALSTYEDALYEYTVSPQLGEFQGWANNLPEHNGIKPNENYAREIQQLLTTGIHLLNDDGTEQLDGAGNAIPPTRRQTSRRCRGC